MLTYTDKICSLMGKRTTRKAARQSPSSDGGLVSHSSKVPMGNFCVLPFEIIEKILSSLPISDITSLASVSLEWMQLIEDWLMTTRASVLVLDGIKGLGRLTTSKTDERTLMSAWSSVGDLIWSASLFSEGGAATRLYWLQLIMAEVQCILQQTLDLGIKWWAPVDNLFRFGYFLKMCFKSSESEELDKVIQAVFARVRMKTYVETQLKHDPGHRSGLELRTRLIIRSLCITCRFKRAAMKFFIRPSEWDDRPLPPSGLARLAFILYGPHIPHHVGWTELTSEKYPPFLKPLGQFLNLPFWREEPFAIKDILSALLGDKITKWSVPAIANLFVDLDNDVSILYLTETSSSAEILVAVGKVSLKTMQELVDKLRNVLSGSDFEELLSKINSAILKEVKSQEKICVATSGKCQICFAMKVLKKIQKTIDSSKNCSTW